MSNSLTRRHQPLLEEAWRSARSNGTGCSAPLEARVKLWRPWTSKSTLGRRRKTLEVKGNWLRLFGDTEVVWNDQWDVMNDVYIYIYIYMCSELLCMYSVIIVILCDSYIYIHICYILWIMYIDFCAITYIYRYIFKYWIWRCTLLQQNMDWTWRI